MLPDPRSKPDFQRFLLFCHVSDQLFDCVMQLTFKIVSLQDSQAHESMVANGMKEPYVIVIGDLNNVVQAFLVVDKIVLYEVEVSDTVFSLLSTFFVFNICYTKGTCHLFQFLEAIPLDEPTKLPPSVVLFRNALESN